MAEHILCINPYCIEGLYPSRIREGVCQKSSCHTIVKRFVSSKELNEYTEQIQVFVDFPAYQPIFIMKRDALRSGINDNINMDGSQTSRSATVVPINTLKDFRISTDDYQT